MGSSNRRMICFPPSGGNSLSFKPLCDMLSCEGEVWAVDPPGHGLSRGKLLDQVEAMADLYIRKLQPFFAGIFSLLGHSLGGLVAFVLASRLEAESLPPSSLTICATQPPHFIRKANRICDLPDSEMVEHLVRMNGIPKQLTEYPKLLNAYMPAIRSDLHAYEYFELKENRTYHGRTLVVGGTKDFLAHASQLGEWERYCPNMNLHIVDGDHFFVQHKPELLAGILHANVGV